MDFLTGNIKKLYWKYLMASVMGAVVIYILSILLLYILPLFLDVLGVWLALSISELITATIALIYIAKTNQSLGENNK